MHYWHQARGLNNNHGLLVSAFFRSDGMAEDRRLVGVCR
jgi:hypothetical protein